LTTPATVILNAFASTCINNHVYKSTNHVYNVTDLV
jgi:hypothetical protein